MVRGQRATTGGVGHPWPPYSSTPAQLICNPHEHCAEENGYMDIFCLVFDFELAAQIPLQLRQQQ